MTQLPLVLASASPRRQELLRALGVSFRVVPASLDETPLAGEAARDHVVRLARHKSAAVRDRLRGEPALVLAADTTVTLDGALLAKPHGAAEALGMLRTLAGRRHDVWTACALSTSPGGDAPATCAASARVRFRPWDEPLARWYVSTGEPFDKAGGYGLQGKGVLLTAGIEGSWSAVVGLPLEELPSLFRAVGDDFLARLLR